MKKIFEEPVLKVMTFETTDVIATSEDYEIEEDKKFTGFYIDMSDTTN